MAQTAVVLGTCAITCCGQNKECSLQVFINNINELDCPAIGSKCDAMCGNLPVSLGLAHAQCSFEPTSISTASTTPNKKPTSPSPSSSPSPARSPPIAPLTFNGTVPWRQVSASTNVLIPASKPAPSATITGTTSGTAGGSTSATTDILNSGIDSELQSTSTALDLPVITSAGSGIFVSGSERMIGSAFTLATLAALTMIA
ncbi:hypothetical protein HDU97_006534 [Phlyctochytrium planicorne]|nr:hypothetical protein HDU97_006534 [Phlyctochytrium planicorne]